ncbi:MAG TPA: D-galactarate dehydratase [Firmicutes bacterium]|jgi:altronate dehydratase|nr:D-galactarate dehydratase [Bacillota bacterium]
MGHILILDHARDNVGVVLKDVELGERITILKNDEELDFKASDRIPSGHKIALMDIPKDKPVMKYGYSIGSATQDIWQGQFVHAHNVTSMRGKELLKEGSDHDE